MSRWIFAAATRTGSGNARRMLRLRATISTSTPGASSGPEHFDDARLEPALLPAPLRSRGPPDLRDDGVAGLRTGERAVPHLERGVFAHLERFDDVSAGART
jgi:hypothetical protein